MNIRLLNKKGSVSLYVIVIIMIVTLVATFLIKSITNDMLSFKLESKKLESDYIAQHGLTLVKEQLYKIILDKEELAFFSLPANTNPYSKKFKVPDETNVELEVEANINTWNSTENIHELGNRTSKYRLKRNELSEGFKTLVLENYPQIQNNFSILKGNNGLDFVDNTNGFGNSGIIDISGCFNKTTLVSDFFIVNLNDNMEDLMFYVYTPIINNNSFELLDTLNIKQFYQDNLSLPNINGLEWSDQVCIEAVYDNSLNQMKVYIAITRDKDVDIFLYEPYSTQANKFIYLSTFKSTSKLSHVRINGIYSESINTIELLLITVEDKTVAAYSFIPVLPSLGFDEVLKNTFDVDAVKSIDTSYIWTGNKGISMLIFGVVTQKNGVEDLSFYENYPYIGSGIKKVFSIDNTWEVFSGLLDLYNVSLNLIYNESVDSSTLVVAVGDTKNNRITVHKAYIELGIWDASAHKAIDLGNNEGVGRLSLAGVGGDFSQVILINPLPIVEEVTYDINNVNIIGKSYNKDNTVVSTTEYIPTLRLIYEEPEFEGDRKILSYELIKILKN